MKRILFVLSVLISSVTYSQTTGFFRYDTVTFQKIGGNSEFKLLNATRGVTGGVLTNMGNGRTAFVMPSAGTVTAANEGVRLSGTTVQLGNLVALSQYTPLTLNGFPLSINHNGVNTAAQSDSNTLRFTNNTTATTITDSLVSPGSSWRVASRIFLGASQYVDFRQDVVAGGSGSAFWRLKAKAGAGGYATIFQIANNGFIPDNLNLAGGYIGLGGTGNSMRWGDGALNKANNSSVTGGHNIAIGSQSMLSVTSGNLNIAVGTSTLQSTTVGRYNVAIGHSALGLADTSFNTAVGAFAMQGTTTGSQNAAFGANSLLFNTTGQKNNAFGAGAMEANTTGNNNAGLGHDVMLHNITGGNNTSVGYLSLATITAGSGNVALGYTAGNTMTTGDSAIFIGATAGTHGSQGLNAGNSIAIGYNAFTTGPNQIVIGNANHVSAKMFGIASGSAPRVLLYNATTKEIFHADTAGFGGGGSGGTTDHTALSNLGWTASGHTGTATNIAGFNGSGAASLYTQTGTGTVVAMQTSPTFLTSIKNQFDASNHMVANISSTGRTSFVGTGSEADFSFNKGLVINGSYGGYTADGGYLWYDGSSFFIDARTAPSYAARAIIIQGAQIDLKSSGATTLTLSGELVGIRSNTVGVGGNMETNTTQVGNVGAGEDDLMTYSVPANMLTTNGDYLEFEMVFHSISGANKTIKLYFGSGLLCSFGPITSTMMMTIKGTIARTGAATQFANITMTSNSGSWAYSSEFSTPAETLSGAVTLKATGTATSNDDIMQRLLTVKYFPNK